MATSANALNLAVTARRSEEQKRLARKLYWAESFTSLWAPVIIFVIAFLIEIAIVELNTAAAAWAQPLLKQFGVLMLAYFVGLIIYRNAVPGPKRLRHLRHEAHELVGEVERVVRARRNVMDAEVRENVLARAAVVDSARLQPDATILERELSALHELSDKHLSAYRGAGAWDFTLGFAKALFVALAIRAVFIEPFKIPSGSMLPTLEIGDQIFVNKFIYGVRIPFTNYVPFVIVRPPQRGDVIVFENPMDSTKDFVKRVVGIPGDKIQILEGNLVLNGEIQPRKRLNDQLWVWDQSMDTGAWSDHPTILFEENLAGHPHAILHVSEPDAVASDSREFVVPPGHVFVMGDNRDNSLDSRFGLGGPDRRTAAYVPYGNIKGKAMVIWLALGHGGFLHQVFGGTGLRTDRLFTPVR